MGNIWVFVGAVSGFLSVALGAFAAHGLSERLEPRLLEVFRTGAQYQMYHALALIMVGLWSAAHPGRAATATGFCFAIGTLVFSGSLYALSLSGLRWLGAITPIGGLLFLAGWVIFAVGALRAA